MGELNFTPAGRIDSSAFAGGKLLVRQSLGNITTAGRTVNLSDNIGNYDLLFVSMYGDSVSSGNYVMVYAGSNQNYFAHLHIYQYSHYAFDIFTKLASRYIYGTQGGQSGIGSVSTSLISGNSVRLVPETGAINSAEFSIYGLKFS